ncbi:MAG: hypothetical protein COU81_03915 [Candidatus Portnoybacteria bacterium CG10_big_fil_rev_8_21_14_0_10_36_7]|uniref:Uncharacterized protein n=1 Tax=Candidatus Portnoybacteria bacterium CG10_big_fil_rev_8_21_14_0_10_36_7 TaxID=1974812 RepID=A0A2M8KD41_9BACT|nr:MAG: hypothetical protein COU81_03915 [Candidatus Portnoybacteria bacterium CG10_big_fil_rev_8_21_14_0_10_36_7]
MPKSLWVFGANPEKAASKVAINAFMSGGLFVVLTLIWLISPHKFSELIITQLVLAIPLLFISSLAYTKIGYQKDNELWDTFAWHTNTIANAFTLNLVGLIVADEYASLALMYFALVIMLFLTYSIINITLNFHNWSQKIYKFCFFVALILFFGLLPIIFKL